MKIIDITVISKHHSVWVYNIRSRAWYGRVINTKVYREIARTGPFERIQPSESSSYINTETGKVINRLAVNAYQVDIDKAIEIKERKAVYKNRDIQKVDTPQQQQNPPF